MTLVARIELDGDFPADFRQNILREISSKLNRDADKIRHGITNELQSFVRNALVSTPEYQSILSGKLRAELGIPNADLRITAVIEQWVSNIKVNVTTGNNPFLSIEIGAIQADYFDVLALPEASYDYERGQIPWLKWLLLEGDKRIISKYEFTGKITRGSRTGMGIMVSKTRGSWQVPPEFSGTSVDNFATRALGGIESFIDSIVEKIVKGSLK